MSRCEQLTQLRLERRLKYFFSTRYRSRSDIKDTLGTLKQMGDLALIGGMLRDLALFGNKGFQSDLDFVIDPWDLREFEDYMQTIGASKNRFGGYALPSRKWQIDVWPLQKTWAHVAGHTNVVSLNDLKKVTFFTCDAIAYRLSSRSAICSANYFDDLENRILDINLRPNPNPMGNAVRAIRYALLKGFVWRLDLADFVNDTIGSNGWETLIDQERKSFGTNYLPLLDEKTMISKLRQHCSDNNESDFNPRTYQRNVQLPLPSVSN